MIVRYFSVLCILHIFNFIFRTTRSISTKLDTNHSGVNGIQIKVPCYLLLELGTNKV